MMYRHAWRLFEGHFAADLLSPAEAQVIAESEAQIRLAEADSNNIDQVDVSAVKAHLLCLVLLNNSTKYAEQLSRQRLTPEQAASELLQVLDGYVEYVWVCGKLTRAGKLSTSTQLSCLSQLPPSIKDEFGTWSAIVGISHDPMNTPNRDRKPIFWERSSGDQEAPNTGLVTNNNDGSDTPLIVAPLRSVKQQTDRRVIFLDEEVPGIPTLPLSGRNHDESDGGETPLSF